MNDKYFFSIGESDPHLVTLHDKLDMQKINFSSMQENNFEYFFCSAKTPKSIGTNKKVCYSLAIQNYPNVTVPPRIRVGFSAEANHCVGYSDSSICFDSVEGAVYMGNKSVFEVEHVESSYLDLGDVVTVFIDTCFVDRARFHFAVNGVLIKSNVDMLFVEKRTKNFCGHVYFRNVAFNLTETDQEKLKKLNMQNFSCMLSNSTNLREKIVKTETDRVFIIGLSNAGKSQISDELEKNSFVCVGQKFFDERFLLNTQIRRTRTNINGDKHTKKEHVEFWPDVYDKENVYLPALEKLYQMARDSKSPHSWVLCQNNSCKKARQDRLLRLNWQGRCRAMVALPHLSEYLKRSDICLRTAERMSCGSYYMNELLGFKLPKYIPNNEQRFAAMAEFELPEISEGFTSVFYSCGEKCAPWIANDYVYAGRMEVELMRLAKINNVIEEAMPKNEQTNEKNQGEGEFWGETSSVSQKENIKKVEKNIAKSKDERANETWFESKEEKVVPKSESKFRETDSYVRKREYDYDKRENKHDRYEKSSYESRKGVDSPRAERQGRNERFSYWDNVKSDTTKKEDKKVTNSEKESDYWGEVKDTKEQNKSKETDYWGEVKDTKEQNKSKETDYWGEVKDTKEQNKSKETDYWGEVKDTKAQNKSKESECWGETTKENKVSTRNTNKKEETKKVNSNDRRVNEMTEYWKELMMDNEENNKTVKTESVQKPIQKMSWSKEQAFISQEEQKILKDRSWGSWRD